MFLQPEHTKTLGTAPRKPAAHEGLLWNPSARHPPGHDC